MRSLTWASLSFSFNLALMGLVTGCGDLTPPPFAAKYAALRPAMSQSNSLLVVFTYGFGCSADGRGNGLRDMAENVQRTYPNERVVTRGWNDDDDIVNTINNHRGPVMLIGHSFGGCASVDISTQVKRPVDRVVLLDPVPYFTWAIHHSGPNFELPTSVRSAICYYRESGFMQLGHPLANPSPGFENRQREWGHNTFCVSGEVQQSILDFCRNQEIAMRFSSESTEASALLK